ncbi:hypothetical protein H4R24_002969, partial [Coemansia sp. RSA 988]
PNNEQATVYDQIISAVETRNTATPFIDSRTGRGKPFVVNTVMSTLRGRGRSVLPCAATPLDA